MADVVLCTMNARYTHASFGLRCLLANLGEVAARTVLLERTISDRPADIVEALFAHQPRVIGLGVYVWNAGLSLEVARLIKKLRPEIVLVLGGPEVSHEVELQEIVGHADYVIRGEAEDALRVLLEAVLQGQRPATRIIDGGKPDLSRLTLPYALYTDDDLRHRIVYVEASRGCPYTCEFCLSALDDGVRAFPLGPFLEAMRGLLARGLRSFKFVDRTFNLKLETSLEILSFFLERVRAGEELFLHFEMIPDRLPEELRGALAQFPAGTVQLELGVQTLNPEVGATIRRRQSVERLTENFRFLREKTGVHLHADLIVALPGEDLASFGRGFDSLLALAPHEIQVGMLKRLRGAPVARHTRSHGMLYADTAPYEVLQTAALSFSEVQRLKRFSRYFDLVHNSGRFPRAARLLEGGPSAFAGFLDFSDWLWAQTSATHGIALARLTTLLGRYLVEVRGLAQAEVAALLESDSGRERLPAPAMHARRQARHAEGEPPPG